MDDGWEGKGREEAANGTNQAPETLLHDPIFAMTTLHKYYYSHDHIHISLCLIVPVFSYSRVSLGSELRGVKVVHTRNPAEIVRSEKFCVDVCRNLILLGCV